jgi:hypothetical protein
MGVIVPIFMVADRPAVAGQNTQIVTVGAPGEDKKNDSGAKAPARQEKEGRGYRSRFS